MDIEITGALELEQGWRQLRKTLDSGSYMESSSSEYQSASKIVEAYKSLVDALLQHSRAGYCFPE